METAECSLSALVRHVWTPPPFLQEVFDAALPFWSGAVMCPAFASGVRPRALMKFADRVSICTSTHYR
jgi:hypothetical protein